MILGSAAPVAAQGSAAEREANPSARGIMEIHRTSSRTPSAPAPGQAAPAVSGGEREEPAEALSTPLIVGVAAVVLGAISAGVGVGFTWVREQQVIAFNDEACLSDPTRTRGQQCGDHRNAAITAEAASIVAYSLGALIGGAGIVALVIAATEGGDEDGAGASIRCGPAGLGVSCEGRF